jgi:hypothetical protein
MGLLLQKIFASFSHHAQESLVSARELTSSYREYGMQFHIAPRG